MALINYENIDFNKSIKTENKSFDFNGSEIEVIQYLSVNDKYNLIMNTLDMANENGIYNDFKIKVFFELNLIKAYTNIVFPPIQSEDFAKEYDTLKRSGLIDLVFDNINKEEIDECFQYILKIKEIIMKYKNTFGVIASTFFESIPKNLDSIKDLLKNVDINKMNELVQTFSNNQVNTKEN